MPTASGAASARGVPPAAVRGEPALGGRRRGRLAWCLEVADRSPAPWLARRSGLSGSSPVGTPPGLRAGLEGPWVEAGWPACLWSGVVGRGPPPLGSCWFGPFLPDPFRLDGRSLDRLSFDGGRFDGCCLADLWLDGFFPGDVVSVVAPTGVPREGVAASAGFADEVVPRERLGSGIRGRAVSTRWDRVRRAGARRCGDASGEPVSPSGSAPAGRREGGR